MYVPFLQDHVGMPRCQLSNKCTNLWDSNNIYVGRNKATTITYLIRLCKEY